jgi:hypothetical protein
MPQVARPEICFARWGPMPDDHPVPIRVGQAGFYLENDGIAAHEISIETFSIGPSVQASSDPLARIGEKGTGFLPVWLDGFPPFPFNSSAEKWDLVAALAKASRENPKTAVFQSNYGVKIIANYRDSRNTWYRSSADLIYIPSQRRPQFGATVHERVEREPQTNDTGSRMKPDLNLMRRIVLAVEDAPDGVAHNQPAFDGYSRDQVGYHIYLLVEKGLARGIDVTNSGNIDPQFLITGLTPNGHDFAGLARDETRWRTAMEVAENAGVVTLPYIQHLLANSPGARARPLDQERSRADADRGEERSAWLDARRGAKKWTSDLDIEQNNGPTYNTIQRYRSGKKSTHDPAVRLKFSEAFNCNLEEVPE